MSKKLWAQCNLNIGHTLMNKFLLSSQNPLVLLAAILNKNHCWPTSGKFYRHEDWLESQSLPNGGKLLIIQPNTTSGPTVAKSANHMPLDHRWNIIWVSAFAFGVRLVFEVQSLRWVASLLPLHHCGPITDLIPLYKKT